MSRADGGVILLRSTCSGGVNSGTDQSNTTFHVRLSEGSMMCESFKGNYLCV